MYDVSGGKKRCWKCGHVWEPGNNVRNRPNRPDEADCGDILVKNEEGETEILGHKGMCSDGSHCSSKPRGIKEENGEFVVVCSRHRD